MKLIEVLVRLCSILPACFRYRKLGLASGTAGVALMLVLPIQSAAQKAGLPPNFDAYVAHALKEFDTPGLAIAIVKDGQVVLAKGYGVKRLGDPAPVDAHTLFQIASNTKAFTAAGLAILMDQGKLQWDDRVTQFIPDFALSDPYVTREFTVRDMLTHRSGLGLGAGDLLWFHSNYSRHEVDARSQGHARCRNAAAAASPPRACARPADRSSSEATASSGPAAADDRCQARRSGSTCGSVT